MAMTIGLNPLNAFDLSGQLAGTAITYANLTGDTSYPGGTGYAVTTSSFNLSTKIVAVVGTQPLTGGFVVRYDERAAAVRWYVAASTNALTEVTSGGTLAGQVVNVAVWGY